MRDYKLFILNRKNFRINNLVLNKEGDYIVASINEVRVNIPKEKFHRIIKNMHGSITYKGMTFKIPKKNITDHYINIILKDQNGNEASTEIESIHYNATEHVQLINYLKYSQTFISIAYNFDKNEVALMIQSEDKDSKHFLQDFSLENKEILLEIIDFIEKEFNSEVIISEQKEIETFIGRNLKFNFKDISNEFTFKEFLLDIDGNKPIIPFNTISLASYLLNIQRDLVLLGKSRDLEIIKKDIEEKRKQLKNRNELSFISHNGINYLNPEIFTIENQELIINFFEKELSDFSPFDKGKLFWILLQSIKAKETLVNVISYIVDKYNQRKKDNNFLDHKMELLKSCFLFKKYNAIRLILPIYQRYNSKGLLNIIADFSQINNDLMINDYILNKMKVSHKNEITLEHLKNLKKFKYFSEKELKIFLSLL